MNLEKEKIVAERQLNKAIRKFKSYMKSKIQELRKADSKLRKIENAINKKKLKEETNGKETNNKTRSGKRVS